MVMGGILFLIAILLFCGFLFNLIAQPIDDLVCEVRKVRELMEEDRRDKQETKMNPEVKMHMSDGRVIHISANGDTVEFPGWMHK
jgi:hypothetical protein